VEYGPRLFCGPRGAAGAQHSPICGQLSGSHTAPRSQRPAHRTRWCWGWGPPCVTVVPRGGRCDCGRPRWDSATLCTWWGCRSTRLHSALASLSCSLEINVGVPRRAVLAVSRGLQVEELHCSWPRVFQHWSEYVWSHWNGRKRTQAAHVVLGVGGGLVVHGGGGVSDRHCL
jgi:hypothetical protein